MGELITQIFDWFMEYGLYERVYMTPIISMLIQDGNSQGLEDAVLYPAFEKLANGLRACLLQIGFKRICELTGNDFTYNFHSLRGSDIVVTYLSNEPRIG